MTTSSDAPLGVFDSGLGGLTVVRALRERLPGEHIVYLGDTARVPYGTKGPATVVRYATACAGWLVARKVKAIVIACNTVSAGAPERLRADLDRPVLGVIDPGARAAVAATRSGRWFLQGLSPRAGIAVLRAAKAQALLNGRNYVAPDDIQAILPQTAAHRLVPVSDAGRGSVEQVRAMLESVALP